LRSERAKSWHRLYAKLPRVAQAEADDQYARWIEDSDHPGIAFKPVTHATLHGYRCYEARINLRYRAVCFRDTGRDVYVWFWCGTHNEFDKLVRHLR